MRKACNTTSRKFTVPIRHTHPAGRSRFATSTWVPAPRWRPRSSRANFPRLAMAASALETSGARYRRSLAKSLDPSISRSFGELDSSASRVTALWLETKLAHVRLAGRYELRWARAPVDSPAVLRCQIAVDHHETRPSTPCPNCAVSTPAATLKVGEGAVSVDVFEVSNCAAPALPSFDAPASVASGLLACERLSVAPAAASESTCVTDAAAAAVAAADRDAAEARANAARDR